MKSKNILDLVKYLVVEVDTAAHVTALNPQAREFLGALPEETNTLEHLFGLTDASTLFERAEAGEPCVVPLEVDGQPVHLRWECVLNNADADRVVCFATEWKPVQDLLTKVQRESLIFKELVLNILPHHIAESLVANKGVRPKAYRNCTVLFTDVVAFSQLARHLDPVSLIRILNEHFSYYDEVITEYRLEKIKTIGDSYMCASGLPIKKKSHAVDCALGALAMIRQSLTLETEPKVVDGLDLNNWKTRVGLHSGPCISGVVGSQKFVFDIWGDTVNVASRMESTSAPNRINISASTYELIEDFFDCSHRGSQSVKNIGEVEMYYLDGLKPKYASANDVSVPNDDFKADYCAKFRIEPTNANLDLYPELIQTFLKGSGTS